VTTLRRAITRRSTRKSGGVPSIVEILWEDIFTRPGWLAHRQREQRSAECRTVGYLLEKDEKHVRVSSSWSSDERADTTSIPMGAVRSITELRK